MSPFKRYYDLAMEFDEVKDKFDAMRHLKKLDGHSQVSPYLQALVSVTLAYHDCPFQEDLVKHANYALQMCDWIENTESVGPTLSEVLHDLRGDASVAINLEEKRRVRHETLEKNKRRLWVQHVEEESIEDGKKRVKGGARKPVRRRFADVSKVVHDEDMDVDDNGEESEDYDEEAEREKVDEAFARAWKEVEEEAAQLTSSDEDDEHMLSKEVEHEIRAQSGGDKQPAGSVDSTSYCARLVNSEGQTAAVSKTKEDATFAHAFMSYAEKNPAEMRKLIESYERSRKPSFQAIALRDGEATSMDLSFRSKD